MKRVFMTGASGCIGHYIADKLIRETDHELFLLVRNPDKVRFDWQARPNVRLLQGDLRQIERFRDLLAAADAAVLAATVWGGMPDAFDVNVSKTLGAIALLDPERCERVLYFSTASILDRQNALLKEALHFGTDYIRTKYICAQRLPQLKLAERITALYPTLVLGGGDRFPPSHLSAGLPEILKWAGLIRFFRTEGSFHFIHGEDIARIVCHLLDRPPAPDEPRHLVLGNATISANEAIETLCAYTKTPTFFRIPLFNGLVPWLQTFLRPFGVRIQLSAWDRFCLQYRHFSYQEAVSPATFGLPVYCPDLAAALQLASERPVPVPDETEESEEIVEAAK